MPVRDRQVPRFTSASPAPLGRAARAGGRDPPRRRQLVAPLFVREGIDHPQPIASLPGVVQHTRESLRKEVTSWPTSASGR